MNPEYYLDNAATTSLDAAVLSATLPLLQSGFGNPSSLHGPGMDAARTVKRARERLGRLLEVPPRAVTFTGGGTESGNLALKGVFGSPRFKGERLLISAIEHPAVLEAARWLGTQGARVETIPVTGEGTVDLVALKAMLGKAGAKEIRLVSVMAVNNELGTTQPLAQIGALLREYAPRACFHVDAVQAFTKQPLDWRGAGIGLLSLSAHKVHGPKGTGALVRCGPLKLEPLIHGGGQEGGLRSGTENPFGIAAFALAAESTAALHAEQRTMRAEYRRRWLEFLAGFPALKVFRSPAATDYILNFAYGGIPGQVVLHHLEEQGLLVSTGSACSTRKPEPSHVLLAAGLSAAEALSSLRLSFSVHNTLAGLEAVFAAFSKAMAKLRRV